MIVFLRRLKLLKLSLIYIRPLDNKINHFSRSHQKISLRTTIKNSLLKDCCIHSVLAELFSWFCCVYLDLYLLRGGAFIEMVWDYFFCFLEVVQLEFLFLVLGLFFCYWFYLLKGFTYLQMIESFVNVAVCCEFFVNVFKSFDFLCDSSIMIAVQ